MYDIFYVSKTAGNDTDWEYIKSKYPLAQKLTNIQSYEQIQSTSFTKMFWVIWDDVKLTEFNLLDYKVTKWDDMYVHVFKNGEHYDGVCLFPKSLTISQREFSNRFFTDKKEIDIVASMPKGYNRFEITTYDDYLKAVDESSTEMFWAIWPDIDIDDNFKFDYKVPKYNSDIVHVFKNGEHYDGICLFPKNKLVSKKEFHHRFFSEKKEIDIVASLPKGYNRFEIITYDDYLKAATESSTEMFWAIWPDVDVDINFKFDYTVPKHNCNIVHIFKNGEHYDGVCLFPKNTMVSRKEFHHRFFTAKKEIDIVASTPKKYNVYSPNTFEEYQQITDEMFWLVWPEVTVIDITVFDMYFSHHNSYDRRENHVFKNLFNGAASYSSGVILCSKYKPLSNREFINQYAIDKKEHDRVVSKYQYNKHILTSYDEYVNIVQQEKQPLFWGIWPEIEVTDNSIFDMYFDPNNGTYDHDRKENHTFKHLFNNTEIYINGVVLFSKEKQISQREFVHRFLIEKKEHDEVVSKHRLYDVVFISYNESNADKNYERLLEKCPRAKRVHGVEGIHQAHIQAANICDTDMIWIVDGDAVIEENFNFDLVVSSYDVECVHVWRSRNPINSLEYGNGGVKLLPRKLTLNMDTATPDMTTSISKTFKAMQTVSNINSFNTDEFTTWRSAFRECCKLASRLIERQHDDETQQRLYTWCTVGADKLYGEYAISGAKLGRQYGLENKSDLTALRLINNFEWLREQFNKHEQ